MAIERIQNSIVSLAQPVNAANPSASTIGTGIIYAPSITGNFTMPPGVPGNAVTQYTGAYTRNAAATTPVILLFGVNRVLISAFANQQLPGTEIVCFDAVPSFVSSFELFDNPTPFGADTSSMSQFMELGSYMVNYAIRIGKMHFETSNPSFGSKQIAVTKFFNKRLSPNDTGFATFFDQNSYQKNVLAIYDSSTNPVLFSNDMLFYLNIAPGETMTISLYLGAGEDLSHTSK